MDKKQEKIREVGDELFSMAEHNRITNFQQWQENMYDLLNEAFPERERVGDLCAEVDDYLHDKHSFGFCDLCGAYINYDSDPWYDLGLTEGEEQDWVYKGEYLWRNMYSDTAVEEGITDVCMVCFHDLATEIGFRNIVLVDSNLITTTGGAGYANEHMGEFLDEIGMSAEADAFDISFALLINGFAPLRPEYTPFNNDEDKMREFAELPKDQFLKKFGMTETEYDMTKKIKEEFYHE